MAFQQHLPGACKHGHGESLGEVLNPAAFLFAGYPLRDCLRAIPIPYIEVHMTNIERRGIHSILAETAVGVIAGFGVQSYVLGLEAMLAQLKKRAPARARTARAAKKGGGAKKTRRR